MKQKSFIIGIVLLLLTLTGCGSMFGMSSMGANSGTSVEKGSLSRETEPAMPFEMTIPEEPVNTVILKTSEDLRREYSLTVLNPYAKYLGENVTINSQGAEALVRWLCTQDARDAVAEFQEGLFQPSSSTPVYSGWISPAQESTKHVRLMADRELVEIGFLDEILPSFEEAYGYQVELISKPGEELYISAPMGEADVILGIRPGEGDIFVASDYFRQIPGFTEMHVTFCGSAYVLCGPAEDPAGVSRCANLTAALSAVQRAECYFISRGDYSDVHMAERELWEQAPEGSWYFPADTGMGPCLIIAEEMGGYVLSDRLTYALFSAENGVIG